MHERKRSHFPLDLASAEGHPCGLLITPYHSADRSGVNPVGSSHAFHLKPPSLRGGLFCGLMGS